MLKSGLAFHCHHDVLYEWVYNFDERVKYIRQHKEEQELRLRLFKLIPPDRTPGIESQEYKAYAKAAEAYNKAWDVYNKTRKAYYKVREAYEKAREAYEKAREAYEKAWGDKILKLHKQLCSDCTWNGKTIFKEN